MITTTPAPSIQVSNTVNVKAIELEDLLEKELLQSKLNNEYNKIKTDNEITEEDLEV